MRCMTRLDMELCQRKDAHSFNKEMRDTDLYGGFSSEKTVYAVLIESKKKTRLVNIAMREYAKLGDHPSDDALRMILVEKNRNTGRRVFYFVMFRLCS